VAPTPGVFRACLPLCDWLLLFFHGFLVTLSTSLVASACFLAKIIPGPPVQFVEDDVAV